MSHVFLSYSRQDGQDHVSFLEQSIRQVCNFSVWRDIRDIDPVQDFGAELETAIEKASHVVVCLTEDTKRKNSYVRREIGYALALKKPIYVARFHEVIPHLPLVNHTYLDFFNPHPEEHLSTLCEWLGRPNPAVLPAATDDPFRPYLDTLYQFVVGFLRGTVIREIELDFTERPEYVPNPQTPFRLRRGYNPLQARVMPWHQVVTPEPPPLEAFTTFGEAFQTYGERVVLLGEPGAGKTITLLNQLRESITARLDNPTKPLPLFAFITSWDAQNLQPFHLWLHEQQSLLSATQIESMLDKGEAILFLDGLDELGAKREDKNKEYYDPRQRFIQTFSSAVASNRALVTCRLKDYAEIDQQIPLNGAVQLNPLSDDQIREYLAELPELLRAVEGDQNLKNMLRTPLLISLLAFAFRDELTPEQRAKLRDMSHTDDEELRDQIMMLYLERRYLWEASKGYVLPYAYKEWIGKLKIIAYRGVNTFNEQYSHGKYKGVRDLNILQRDNITLDLSADNVEQLLAFSQALNVIIPLEGETFRFQHLLLMGSLAVPLALECLEQHQEVNEACSVLGALQAKRAVPALIQALGDADKDVRHYVADALGKIGDTRAVEPLIQTLGDVESWFVRSAAATALGELGDTRATDYLIAALNDEDDIVRGSAARSLGNLKDNRCVVALRSALDDKTNYYRKPSTIDEDFFGNSSTWYPKDSMGAIIRALGILKDEASVSRLGDLLNFDEYQSVWVHIAEALRNIDTVEAWKAVNDWENRDVGW